MAVAIGAGILAPFLALMAFSRLGQWLVIADPLPPSLDVIFVFAGEAYVRVDYASELAKRYPTARLLVSGRNYKGTMARISAAGIDTTRAEFTDDCRNTWEEIRFLTQWLSETANATQNDENNQVTLGLVSSPYHMRRISLLARRQSLGSHAEAFFLPHSMQPDSTGRRSQWWTAPESRVLALTETVKIAHNALVRCR